MFDLGKKISGGVYSQGKFYCVSSSGDLFEVDPALPQEPVLECVIMMDAPELLDYDGNAMLGYNFCILESEGDVYFIEWILDCRIRLCQRIAGRMRPGRSQVKGIRVYKADVSEKRWVGVKSLGDRAFFVGRWGNCFGLSASKDNGIREDCIYLMHDGSMQCWSREEFDLNEHQRWLQEEFSYTQRESLQQHWLQQEEYSYLWTRSTIITEVLINGRVRRRDTIYDSSWFIPSLI